MKISLSDHFTYKKLLFFTVAPIGMMIFTSIYGIVDGLFVSRFVGKTAFSSVNFIMPYLSILGAPGFMFGSGGSALVAKTMGEGRQKKALELFSLFVYATLVIGAILGIGGIFLLKPAALLLGADQSMLADCALYGSIILPALPFFMLQIEFHTFFVTAEKPRLGLYITILSGVANMVLDALLVGVLHMGLIGAALATAISQILGGLIPLIYFFRKNSSILRLGKTHFDSRALLKGCSNGASELMSNISMSLVNMLYNFQLMRYIGQDGISAYGVLMYVCLIFLSIFIGYSMGTAPVISFHFGAGNKDELKSLLRKSLVVIISSSALMLLFSLAMSSTLAKLFVGYDKGLCDLTTRAFYIFSFNFLFAGLSIYGSSFFTALNDGLTSALISFCRSLVCQVAAVLLLPLIFDVDGIWISIVVAEVVSAAMTLIMIFIHRKKYGYL